jgi:hypothetical protein
MSRKLPGGEVSCACQRAVVRRTHDGLPLFLRWTVSDDPPDIVLEPLIQHPVRFVQHKVSHTCHSSANFVPFTKLSQFRYSTPVAKYLMRCDTHLDRSKSPASAKSNVLPGVPTTFLTSLLLNPPNCSSFPTPPNKHTLAIPSP